MQGPTNDTPRFTKGQWDLMEIHAIVNTPGNVDGTYRVWINNTIVINETTKFAEFDAAQQKFTAIRITGTRGGGTDSAPVPTGGQSRRYSRFAVYGV